MCVTQYCWPVHSRAGEACETLKGNPTLIQVALTFCWGLREENVNVAVMARAKVIRSWECVREMDFRTATRLSDGSSPRSGKPFYGAHSAQWEPLKALDQGNAITRLVHSRLLLYKAIWALCQMQSQSSGIYISSLHVSISLYLSHGLNQILEPNVLLCGTHGPLCP